MFRITRKKGFHITFENGYTVSVQFGPANYCMHYDREIGRDEEACGGEGSIDAECAVWGPDHEMIVWDGWQGTVGGRMESVEVLRLLNWAAAQEKKQ